jgi:hypothetical protein
MSKVDETYNRIAKFEGRLSHTRGSFISALQVAYGRTDAPDDIFTAAVDEFCADLRRLMTAVEDAEDYRERLHDLVMLKAQDDIGCVPPPTKDQWEKAWSRASEPFEP